jgi:hypothetical protein
VAALKALSLPRGIKADRHAAQGEFKVTMPDEKLKDLKKNIENKVEDLAATSSEHDPESEQVKAAKHNRALAEKELIDYRNSNPKNED